MEIFFSKAQRDRYYHRLRIKIYLIAGAVSLFFVLGAWLVLNFPLLRINKFELVNLQSAEEARGIILNNWLARFLGFNNFLSWPSQVSDIEIKKEYFGRILTLTRTENPSFAIWCARECYWIDNAGIALEPAPDTEGLSILKISDSRDILLAIGKPVINGQSLSNIIKIVEGLKTTPLRPEKFEVNEEDREFRATGSRGEKLIFSLQFEPSAKIFSYLAEITQNGRLKSSAYADFTVENRIYLKPR